MSRRIGTKSDRGVVLTLTALLVIALGMRSIRLDQPIVENYVGRQIPTAMVARNLERGSGFLSPELDVAPFPNRFLVEPPVYATIVVALRRCTGLNLEASGRLVSALGIVLGGWGLFGLVSRREGPVAALVSVAVIITLPVTIRYGRSFQPDALMLGALLAGIRGWDEFEHGEGRSWLILSVLGIACGLALKVTSAGLVFALLLTIIQDRRWWKFALAASLMIPAALWYVYAASVIGEEGGSRASADNGAVWLGVLRSEALFRSETYRNIARFLLVRSFTPLGLPLAMLAFVGFRRDGDQLWRCWSACAFLTLLTLAAKLHHEYYWLLMAPVIAVGAARTLRAVYLRGVGGRILSGSMAAGFLILAMVFSASTWQTPAEWRNLEVAARSVQARVPSDAWIIAPEALLFQADRRGYRLEISVSAATRAAGEWGVPESIDGPESLVEFYERHGAQYFADVCAPTHAPARLALRRWVRDRYNVLMETPEVFLAEISAPREQARTSEGAVHGTGRADEIPREAR